MHIIPRHIFSWAASLLLSFCGYSQSSSYCSNTAMVPVFKQTFDSSISSSTISMAPGGSTNYLYGNVGTDGRYIVTPRVENAGKGDWTRGGDHTGDSNGNMFLVNAGSNKSILLQQTVNNLCSGSSYSFSAWAANVNTSKTADICGTGLRYPKLTFNIKTLSNVLLASYTTGNLPLSPDNGPVNWQKYGFQFDLPANTSSLRIEIVDAWGGGDACGNDLALDDILFEACIPQITVSLNSSNSNVCVGTSATIQSKLVNSPYTSPAYQWQKSADGISWANLGSPVTGTGAELLNFPSSALTDGGLYRVTVAPTSSSLEIATCSAHSNELSFTVNPLPQVAPSSNGPLCSGKDLSLKANASGGSGLYTQYLWTGPASFQSLHADTIIHAVQTTADGTYTIKVTDSKGCSASGNLPVQINSTPTISVSSITDTICSGTTGLLSVISSIPNSSFYWDANVVAGVLTGNTTTTSPDLSGIQQSSLFNNSTINGTIRYNVYALTPANCSSDTLFPPITVLPNPDTPDAGIDTTLCNTIGFQLYGNTPVVGAGAWTQISGPNTAVFADSTLAHTAVLNLVPGTYRFAWRISNSCASTADTMMLHYTAKPAPAFALSDTSICGQASISFTNNTPNKSDYGFSWIFGNGTSSSLADPADVVFAPSVTGSDTTYNITLKAFTSCDTISITKTILVKQLPKAGLTVIPQNTCMPTNAQLINHSMGSNTTYKMIFGDSSDSIVMATDTLMHLYNAPSSTSFQPMVIATNSCGADTATASFLATANLLNIQTNLADTAVCGNPYTANFTNNTTGATQFTWSWGDGTADYTSTTAGPIQYVYQDSGTYTVSLRILHACGDTTISSKIHVYSPAKSLFSVADNRICAGDSVQLINQSDISLQFFWKINNDTIHTFSPKQQFSLPGSYHPALFVSKTFPLLTCTDSSQLSIIVDSVPVIQFNQVSNQACAGQIANISINSSMSPVSYFWNNSSNNTPDIQHITNSAVRTTLELRDTVYAIALNGCRSNWLDTLITVNPLPDTAHAGTDTAICNSTGFQLYANTPAVGAGAWIQISGPNNALFADSTLANTTVTNLIPGTYRFAWRISNSCASTTDTMMLYYTAKPAPAFTLSDTSICGPASISFINNTPNKSDYSFSWDFGNGSTSILADPTAVVFAPSANGLNTTYTITLKAFTNCDTISISKTILVKQLPKAGLTVTPQNTCMPTNAQLINHSMGSNTTYKMIFGDGSDSIVMATDTLMHLYNAPSSTSFQPMVIATNSCGADTATAILQTIANLVNIRLNLQDTAVCGAPFELSFRNSSSGIPQFNWNWGDGTTSTSSDTGIVQHKYLQPGIYQLTLPIHGVCGDTIITRNIHIYPAVKAVFDTISANNCIGDSIRFRSISAHAEQLQWNINNSKVSNLQEFNFAFKQTGVFPVQLIANMANPLKTCSDSISRNIRIIGVQPGKGSITPLNGNCLPFVVQLTNQTNKPTSSVQWLVSNGESTSGDSASFTFNQSGTYKVLMQARNTGGCLFTDSATIQIKSPAGIIQYKGGAYCSPNNPISFTPQVSNTDSIEWNFGDGTILTTAVRTIKHQYKQQGIFRPVFTLISNTGCRIPIRNTDSIVIEVVKAGFSVNTVYECGTTTFHFKDSSTALNGIRNHYWRVNSQPAGNGRSAMASFKRTGAQLTELSVESNFGCTDNIRGAYNVGIYNFPQVHINSINEACMNNLMELKSNISSADSVIYRLWNLGNGQSATDSAVKVLYYDEGVYKVKLTASTVNTCYDSAIKQIAIHALPPISIAKEKNICTGDSIVLRVDGTASYVWKDQQNNMICNNCNTITVRPKESTQYQVIGYNEYGCSNIASTNVKVIKPGKLQVSPESVVCEGSSVRIWASGGSSYQWMPAPGLTIHNTAAPVVSPMSTTTYKVVGKDLYNCFTDTAFTRVVVGKPTPVSVGKDTSFIAGSKIKLRTEVTTNNIVQWKWSGGADLSCVFCPEPVARVVNDEDIACTVTNEFGCVTSDTLKIRTFCPGAEVFIPNAFSPDGDGRNDWLYIQARGIKLVKNLRIYSRWGELVFEKTNFLPNDPTAGWNGSIRGNPANPDIYVYVCEVICEKGTPQLYKGNVAILK
ncbi:MAG: gliding motility-associated C-terminal domain-containing protein [Sediminibacterium sp.]|nr:gliding motility-associated C-terminal domain-containing protein [Sediminibacterium sp.]